MAAGEARGDAVQLPHDVRGLQGEAAVVASPSSESSLSTMPRSTGLLFASNRTSLAASNAEMRSSISIPGNGLPRDCRRAELAAGLPHTAASQRVASATSSDLPGGLGMTDQPQAAPSAMSGNVTETAT